MDEMINGFFVCSVNSWIIKRTINITKWTIIYDYAIKYGTLRTDTENQGIQVVKFYWDYDYRNAKLLGFSITVIW